MGAKAEDLVLSFVSPCHCSYKPVSPCTSHSLEERSTVLTENHGTGVENTWPSILTPPFNVDRSDRFRAQFSSPVK